MSRLGREEFGERFDEFRVSLYRIVSSATGLDRSAVEEALSETAVAGLKNPPLRGSFRAWAVSTALRRAAAGLRTTIYRRRLRSEHLDRLLPAVPPSVEDVAADRLFVTKLLQRLEPVTRDIVWRTAALGESYAAAGARHGVSRNTALRACNSGLARLRALFWPEDSPPNYSPYEARPSKTHRPSDFRRRCLEQRALASGGYVISAWQTRGGDRRESSQSSPR